MWLTLTASFSLVLGTALSRRVWRSESADAALPIERVLFGVVIGISVWLGSTWILALAHLLSRPVLIARTLAIGLAAAVVIAANRRRAVVHRPGVAPESSLALYVVALAPVVAWLAYSLWRGWVAPPLSLDALSYHLPTAVLYDRAHGYDALRSLRFVISWRPSNYELLLADGLAIDGGDRIIEWLSTLFFAAFILSAVALVQRWWRRDPLTDALTILFTVASPVLLLHSADLKNDVMSAFFITAAVVASGRWLSQSDTSALGIAIVSFACAVGTKAHAVIPAALAVPLLIWPMVRGRQLRRVAGTAAFALAAFLVLGGYPYVAKAMERLTPSEGSRVTGASVTNQSYGSWLNLLTGPYVLIAAPLSPSPKSLFVPWEDEPWPWQRYELYYSELGLPFALCALVMPVLIARFRSVQTGPALPLERVATTTVVIAAALAIMPVHYVPAGRYLTMLPRFVLFVVPVVFAWTVPPLADWCRRRARLLPHAIVAAACLCAFVYELRVALYDTFAPLGYVLWKQHHLQSRDIPITLARRSAIARMDALAGPRDHVLLDGDSLSVNYLAFGKSLTRIVKFVPPGQGPVLIDPDVQWIAVDRVWSMAWGHPDFKDLGESRRFLGRGEPTADDLRVLRALWNDPKFALVYFEPRSLQALFRRR